jgi:hypothetical protein
MTPEYREQFRHALIRILAAAGAVGMKRASLKISLDTTGFDSASGADLDNELDYLAGKSFAGQMDKTISPEVARWKITAAGRDYAAREGLA